MIWKELQSFLCRAISMIPKSIRFFANGYNLFRLRRSSKNRRVPTSADLPSNRVLQFPLRKMPPKKIEVFSRHAFFSSISRHKKRIKGFSHEKCYQNLIETFDFDRANLTFFFDAARGPLSEHYLKNEKNVVQIEEGTEAGSFIRLLDYVTKLDLHPETVIYFVEDDYLHRPDWLDILLEGVAIADYATLYDHNDKYFLYPELKSRIFATSSCHWRTTPSTTNTFALQFKTLIRDLSIHQKFSLGRAISADHEKFCYLEAQGIMLISPMPGWSTHAEPEFASPCIDWEQYLTRSSSHVLR